MPFGLTIGTERATALQQSIQDELTKRLYSPEPDPVMAEYITIMIINNKTAAQITSELEDLIGSDFDPSFTDWLFAEAAKGATEATSQAESSTSQRAAEPAPPREAAPPAANDVSRRPRNNGVYQQALTQALPSASPSGQKRSASARSPSPNQSNKIRRTDVPTGPRAMLRDGPSNPRSLLDRVGGPGGGQMRNNFGGQDDIQSRIDNIVNNPTPEQQQAMMMNAGFPMGMDMNVMNAGMANPLMLQEMMMNQMALMAQMASTMGIINPATGQFGGPGFGGIPGDMSMFPGGMDNNGFQGPMGGNGNHNGRGRGAGRGRGGRGTGRGGSTASVPRAAPDTSTTPAANGSLAIPIVAPTPTLAPATPDPPATSGLVGFILPERPQSPTLCKFGLKCTNAHCRYSHASPVATPESGVVLSNEACEKGKDCKDKDCIKAHVSPAVLNPQAASQPPLPAHAAHNPPPAQHQPSSAGVPCRYGAACTRANCTFTHPPKHPSNSTNPHFAQQCHFGAGCTRANCHFQHPEGRVLPTTFHRGLSTSAPLVNVPTPETGSMGAPSPHRSVKFNQSSGNANVKEKLEQQMKEIEEKKNQAEKAVKAAEAAATAKKEKEEVKPVTISA